MLTEVKTLFSFKFQKKTLVQNLDTIDAFHFTGKINEQVDFEW